MHTFSYFLKSLQNVIWTFILNKLALPKKKNPTDAIKSEIWLELKEDTSFWLFLPLRMSLHLRTIFDSRKTKSDVAEWEEGL